MADINYDRAKRELHAAQDALEDQTKEHHTERARVDACRHARLALLLLTGSTIASILDDDTDPES